MAQNILTKSLPPPPTALPTDGGVPPVVKLVIALVCHGRPEAMLPLAVSLLNLQTMFSATDIQLHLNIVDTFDQAVASARSEEGAHLFAVDTNVGFSPEFVARALKSPHQIVTASYPLPGVNWDRVKSAPVPSEPMNFRGNSYNTVPAPTATAAVDGYVEVLPPRLGCVVVKAGVAEDILQRHPDAKVSDGVRLAYETVGEDGKLLGPHETFAKLWGKPIYMDVEFPASLTAPLSFAGSAGARHVLR